MKLPILRSAHLVNERIFLKKTYLLTYMRDRYVLCCHSDTGEILSQMGAGDFFGEIGILNLDGGVNKFVSRLLTIIFTARCTLVQSAVLPSHVVCLSVRLSVCLSVCL